MSSPPMTAAQDPVAKRESSDRELAPWQVELLEIAFRSASAMPTVPHAKNRARLQEDIVEACIELDQTQRARRYTEKIDDWRRGVGYGELAVHCARHGRANDAELFITLARETATRIQAEYDQSETGQSWHIDRIRGRIAAALAWMGRDEQSRSFQAELSTLEKSSLEPVNAARVDEAAFDARVKALDALVASGDLDQVKSALEAYVELYGRFHADARKRDLARERIELAWGGIPVLVRIDLTLDLARAAIDHGDSPRALEWIGAGRAVVEGVNLTAEYRVPLRAKLAALRWRAGERDEARAELDAALSLFDEQRDSLVNIYRAGALRPVAEAYGVMGDAAAALRVYRRAIEAGVENPNSRPRAEDLAATCCSMARCAIEPDAELFERVRRIRCSLNDPW